MDVFSLLITYIFKNNISVHIKMITTSLCSLPFYDFCAQAKCLDADTGAKHVSCARVISGATGFISLPNPRTGILWERDCCASSIVVHPVSTHSRILCLQNVLFLNCNVCFCKI